MNELKAAAAILLISCYELGHQPVGIAMPMGFLRRAGYQAEAIDLSVSGFEVDKVMRAKFIGICVPMHTALRLGVAIAKEIRTINPHCHLCFYGLYASLNADYLLAELADSTIGGEYESALLALIETINVGGAIDVAGVSTKARLARPLLTRLPFALPDRGALPPLNVYARLQMGGEERLTGYVEASRGCLHHCAHCPIPSVYHGRFFIVPTDIVMADIEQLVAAGARHITFGDPDFLNGPNHSLRIARALREQFPQLTFDFTAKVEHILKHRSLLAEFAQLGCVFIVSALESFSDIVLAQLEKGHTRADILAALSITRAAGIVLRPSLVAFTPWTTLDDYIEMLAFIASENIIDQIDPVQYTIRLLVPPGSLLRARGDSAQWLGPLAQAAFAYQWQHPDARMDRLHKEVAQLVEQALRAGEEAATIFHRVRALAFAARGDAAPEIAVAPARELSPPRLTEAWFC